MKLLITGKKKLIALFILAALAFGCSLCWLAVRVYEVVEYFGTAAEDPAAEPSSPEGGNTDGKDTLPPPPPGNERKKGEVREHPITPTATGELPVTTPKTSGILKRTKVDLPPEALDWTKDGRHPIPGDLIRVNIPGAREYTVEVQSFEVEDNAITLLGTLCGEHGECSMLAIRGRINVRLIDRKNNRTYYLFYHLHEDSYTIEEVDPSLIPPAIM